MEKYFVSHQRSTDVANIIQIKLCDISQIVYSNSNFQNQLEGLVGKMHVVFSLEVMYIIHNVQNVIEIFSIKV